MSGERPVEIPEWAWDKACEAMNRAGWHMRSVRIEAAKAILAAVEEEREAIASYVEGKGSVLPGTNVFAYVVSRNNQPCMSGDARDRLNKFDRRAFDAASASLASAIRNRKES